MNRSMLLAVGSHSQGTGEAQAESGTYLLDGFGWIDPTKGEVESPDGNAFARRRKESRMLSLIVAAKVKSGPRRYFNAH
jgi:hypothetical protein